LPFLIWNFLIGLTIFLHHTHPAVPWFKTTEIARINGGDDLLSINVLFPRWYALLSHNIMDHPAHHLNPLIPWYRLHCAQRKLIELLGSSARTEAFGVRYLWVTVRTCKLYDYDSHDWLDFSGRPTSHTTGSWTRDVSWQVPTIA
jgi:omega-6 fatty acid desaturase (delta-12 desaturase)